jgi:undecaprenyl-diphosphatase
MAARREDLGVWGWLEQFDHTLFFWINRGLGRDWLDPVFGDLSVLGGWSIALVTVAALAADGGRVLRRHLLVLFVAIALFAPVNRALKSAFSRTRPLGVFAEQVERDPDYVRLVNRERLYRSSFPSGHSAFAFFIMHYLALAKPRSRYAAWSLAALAAFSRVYAGVHFPLDCLAGAALGVAGGKAAWLAYARLWPAAAGPPAEEGTDMSS